MKQVFLSLVILCSSTLAQAAISDRYCTIGVPEVSSGFLDFTIRDSQINVLINKGYRPYRVEYTSQVTSGLMLEWSFYSRKTIFGNYKKVYKVSVVSKENGRKIMLGSDEAGSLESALSGLPNCRLN